MMATLVHVNQQQYYAADVTCLFIVEGEHEQDVIEFANKNWKTTIHEKKYEQLEENYKFEPISGVPHLQLDITDIVRIDVRCCNDAKCEECFPPLSFPLIISLGASVGASVESKCDKLFELCNTRQMDSLILSDGIDIIENSKPFGMSLFLLVEEDDEEGYTVRETRLGELGSGFLRTCEFV